MFGLMGAAALLPLSAPVLVPITPPSKVGVPAEWAVRGLPEPTRPFDPSDWNLFGAATGKDGKATTIRGFWYVPQQSGRAADGKVVFKATGPGEWRIRVAPTIAGPYKLNLTATQSGQTRAKLATTFKVKPGPLKGFARVSKANPHYIAFADGAPFIPIGWNVCWWDKGGLQDYDRWAERMQAAGMNFARLWMGPWSFGLESEPSTLGNYDLGRAWALDYVLEVFRKRGVHVMLCFDYHGMLNQTKDFWGSNDNWRMNPYNAANGGPAKNQNDFFTDNAARNAYKQRLGYIVARYASFPNIAAWEFWNEIDNVGSTFKEADMIEWHRIIGKELRELDPYGRLVTTSLTSDVYPTLWSKAKLDLVQSHAYNTSNPGPDFAERARKFRKSEGKPYLVGEYGVDFRGPNIESDPKSRGLKQALWGSLLGGGAGTAQSWWWETLDAMNIYPMYRSVATFAKAAPIGSKGWGPMDVSAPEEPTDLPPVQAGAKPFDVRIPLVAAWGDKNRSLMLLTDRDSAPGQGVHVNGYLHGTSKPEIRRPFRVAGHFGPRAGLTFKVNSVSNRAEIKVLVNGQPVYSGSFPDKDGKYEIRDEYSQEVPVSIPAGRHLIELVNEGPDWAAIDWIEFRSVLPTQARKAEGIPLRAVASGTATAAVVWVLDPAYSYPSNAKQPEARLLAGTEVRLKGLRSGAYRVRWFDTATGKWQKAEQAQAKAGSLVLNPPAFREDVACLIEGV